MKRNEIKVGQLVTVGMEVEFWNSDDTNVDYRTDRWAKWEIASITELGPDYGTIEFKCADGVVDWTIELDVDYADIELAK